MGARRTIAELRITWKRVVRSLLPRSVSPHRILSGPLRGRAILTSWHDYPAAILGYTEKPLLAWFANSVRVGETWLDVGAHYGYTALALSELVGATGRVYAFEPSIVTAGHLAASRRLNRLQQLIVVPLALGGSKDIRPVSVPIIRGMAEHSVGEGQRETIFEVSLDTLWRMLSDGAGRLDGVKIDVQGMELDVLSGMRQTLAAFHPKLVIELHAGVSRAELIKLLESLGYNGRGRAVETPETVAFGYEDDHSYVFTPLNAGPKPVSG